MSRLDHVKTYLQQAREFRRSGGPPVSGLMLCTFFLRWERSLHNGATPLRDQQPWLTFPALEFLERMLRPDMRVFEWGSGGSTLFFLERAGTVVTVEHDATWSQAVDAAIGQPARSRWQLKVIPPVPETAMTPGDPATPEDYASSESQWRGHSFRAYATSIEMHPAEWFDLVVVDGRARPSCARHALAALKQGGVLLLDNAERPHYAQVHHMLKPAGWEQHELSGPGPYNRYFWRTCAWQKPRHARPTP